MKIAIFGATGGTGREIVQQALAQGHELKALVRNPAGFTIAHPALTIVPGNVLEPAPVAETVSGSDAVIITLGNTANNPDYIVSEGTKQVLAAMEAQKVRRLIVITSIGVGESKDQVPLAFKMLMKSVLRKPMEDKERQEALVKASGLDWIIVRPGGLTDGPATGSYQSGLDPKLKAGQVSRADVAAFTLQQLTDDTYLHKAPAIS
ncbi:MAG: SDR family oxidoreductase [Ardenticatenaceae bacterium]|nr:SDR family oxidoreductase [Anaerolineales bacterium]MCB8919605.1 SDR family oxidoreductase [Ardenticatenaceae bacterium]